MLLIRNNSENDCNANLGECEVVIYVAPAIDSNSDGKCESFGSYWSFTLDVSDRSAASAWPWVVGDFFTADGLGCLDLVIVIVKGTFASWYAIYSNGVNAFINGHAAVSDMEITNSETHFVSKVFGIGNFVCTYSPCEKMDDFIAITDQPSDGILELHYAWNASSKANVDFGTWYEVSALNLPVSQMVWDQATDWDRSDTQDNGGDDAKQRWWCEDCNVWTN